MSILKVGSDNPKLSFILSKNPATIRESKEPFTKNLRKGKVYGWYSKADDSEFTLLFKDSETDVSFANHNEFEYLDRTRYSSPYAPISMITHALTSALKEESDFDTREFHSYVETTIKISNGAMASAFVKHSEGMVSIERTSLAGDTYKLRLSGNSVQLLLNTLVSFCIIQCIYDKDCYVDMDSQAMAFYIRAINRINAPYFIRYIFSRTAFRDKNTFNKYQKDIQLPDTEMHYGDTQRHRYDAIEKYLLGGDESTLIDIGCGELYYTKRLSKRYTDVFAFDADPLIMEDNIGKVKGWKLDNVSPMGEVTPEFVQENLDFFEEADVLMTEVIEHVSLQEAENILKSLLTTKFNKLIVTTPNRDFNVNYNISPDAMRHSDHKWEMSLTDYQNWVEELSATFPVKLTTIGIGDSVNGVYSVSMTIFERIEDGK